MHAAALLEFPQSTVETPAAEHAARLDEAPPQAAAVQPERETASAAELLREKLTYMLVHDLRNPLGSVLMGLELMEDFPAGGAIDRDTIQLIRRQVRYGLQMCEQLLEVHRLERGELKVRPARVNLYDFIADVEGAVRMETIKRHIRLQFFCNRYETVHFDVGLMKRVLVNIIGNAIKHTPDMGVVTLSASIEDGRISFWVLDRGPGIAPEFHDKIFELFGMVEVRRETPGLGMGLAFCKLAVAAMGGTIGLDSEPGQGCHFTVSLPHATGEDVAPKTLLC